MRVRFLDMEDNTNPLNGTWIDDADTLKAILEGLRHREAFGLQLDAENGTMLDVCLAKSFGSVQLTTTDNVYLLAVKPGCAPFQNRDNVSPHTRAFVADEKSNLKSPEFLVGGTPTPIPTRYILPYELVKKIAVHFLETADRHPDVRWEKI
jgi:hypothetical protein